MKNLEDLLQRQLISQEQILQKMFEIQEFEKFIHQERMVYDHSFKIFRNNINVETFSVKKVIERAIKEGVGKGLAKVDLKFYSFLFFLLAYFFIA